MTLTPATALVLGALIAAASALLNTMLQGRRAAQDQSAQLARDRQANAAQLDRDKQAQFAAAQQENVACTATRTREHRELVAALYTSALEPCYETLRLIRADLDESLIVGLPGAGETREARNKQFFLQATNILMQFMRSLIPLNLQTAAITVTPSVASVQSEMTLLLVDYAKWRTTRADNEIWSEWDERAEKVLKDIIDLVNNMRNNLDAIEKLPIADEQKSTSALMEIAKLRGLSTIEERP